jgi:CubicO group peptidase (beta-lactamase class C family)
MNYVTIHRFFPICLAIPFLSAQSTTDQHIAHIENALLPPVLVKGEPVKTQKLTDAMAEVHVPGVSVAFIHDGKIAWARGFGVMSIAGPPVTPETLFQAASISKPLTALAVLHFVEAGKLDLDTDVNQYLKSWKLPQNQFTAQAKITIRELLTHTAGLTVHGFAGYASDAPVPSLVQVLNGEKPANNAPIRVDTTPGTLWRYSGGGYVILQQILQDLTGEPFATIMHDTVLAPIGMTKSTYEQPLPKSRLQEAATPYDSKGQPVAGGPHTYPEQAPAGLWTTPSDLAHYAIDVQKSLAGTSNRVVSAAMTHQMLTPGMNDWGLGPQVGGTDDHRFFTHGGSNEGYKCNFVAFDKGDGVAIMTNGDNGGELALEILRTVAKEHNWPHFQPEEYTITKTDPKLLDACPGSYNAPFGALNVTRKDNDLFVAPAGQPPLRMYYDQKGDFFVKEFDASFTCSVGAGGKATQLILHQQGQNVTAKRK